MNGDMWVGVLILAAVVLIPLGAMAFLARRRDRRRDRPLRGKYRKQAS